MWAIPSFTSHAASLSGNCISGDCFNLFQESHISEFCEGAFINIYHTQSIRNFQNLPIHMHILEHEITIFFLNPLSAHSRLLFIEVFL